MTVGQWRMPNRWRRPPPAWLPAPLPEELVAEFRDRPFATSYGETVGHVQPTVEPLPSGRPVIPPPDWEQEAAERVAMETSLSIATPGTEVSAGQGSAVEQMMTNARELGELDEPPPLGPPVIYPPLRRPVFPAPDWRAEDSAREARSEP